MSTLGVILLLCAGFSQGSFGLGMKYQNPIRWSYFWLIYSIVGMLLIPIIWGMASTHLFWDVIFNAPSSVLIRSITLGFLWGIGGILFGKSVAYVGISITNGVVMGLAGGLGAIIPLLSIPNVTKDSSFVWVLLGVFLMLVGVAISAYAGLLRDKCQRNKSEDNVEAKSSKKFFGIIIVVAAGILSSLLNVGFESATPFVGIATDKGVSQFAAGLPSRSVVVFGGFLMNALYALFLILRGEPNEQAPKRIDLKSAPQCKAVAWAGITGVLWFLPLGLSGIVAVMVGALGNTITWPIMLSLSLIFGNLWGYVTGEWKGASKAFLLVIFSSIILILACLLFTFKNQL